MFFVIEGCGKIPASKILLLRSVKSFELGFGIEVDVRDYRDELIVAHCPFNGNSRLRPVAQSSL